MMTNDEAFELIKKALDEVSEGASESLTMDTHLLEDDILDSLDAMSFMFELEKMLGKSLAVDEEFSDFKITTLIDLMQK
tara:strand:- start:7297 stop:7533 length:237 start_codon:yes stop_codon:yes gene_type:complete